MAKRIRGENWSNSEKALLLQLVEEDLQLIENKSQDGRWLKEKQRSWYLIAQSMAENGYLHDAQRIKQQWMRLKSTAKKNISAFVLQQKVPGASVDEPSYIDKKIWEMVPEYFEKDVPEFDYNGSFKTSEVSTDGDDESKTSLSIDLYEEKEDVIPENEQIEIHQIKIELPETERSEFDEECSEQERMSQKKRKIDELIAHEKERNRLKQKETMVVDQLKVILPEMEKSGFHKESPEQERMRQKRRETGELTTYEKERLKQEDKRLKMNEEIHSLTVVKFKREIELLELQINAMKKQQ